MAAMVKERVAQWANRFIRLPVAGLDISDRSIKYVKFAAGNGVALETFGEKEIAEGIVVEGRIERPADFVLALRDLTALLGGRFAPLGVVASLPEEKSFLRLVQMPVMKPEEVAGALRWQIESQIPLPAEDIAYDYEVIEPFAGHPDHLDVVITAYPKRIVDSYTAALKEAGFQPMALEMESQAIARAVLGGAHTPDAAIVIDLGRYRTSIAVCAAGSVLFTATLPVGGQAMETKIEKACAVSPEEALRLKKETGFIKSAMDGKIYAALLPLMEALAAELLRTIAYYEDHLLHIHGSAPGIARVLICGGDASLLGLDTYLSSRTRVPAVLADPFGSLMDMSPYPIPEIPRHNALAYTAAIGLAMRGSD